MALHQHEGGYIMTGFKFLGEPLHAKTQLKSLDIETVQ